MGACPTDQYGHFIRDARHLSTVAKKPHIIVFANEKGGTGKSTTAV
ncbi:MAG: division plane positioning ATPase MipZ, partial [Sphingomonas sp.]